MAALLTTGTAFVNFRTLLYAALIVICSLAGPATAAHVRSVIVLPSQARAAPQGLPGTPVYMPVEVLDTPVESTSGFLAKTVIIARHTVRAVDAVVLMDAVNQGGIEIAAGTVLAKVTSPPVVGTALPAPVWWCITKSLGPFHLNQIDCLSGPVGSDKLDQFWNGHLSTMKGPFTVATISRGVQITPVAFRVARPEERPTTLIAYKYCPGQGDGVSAPARFTTAVAEGDAWVFSIGGCPFGEWLDPDKSITSVDSIKVRITGAGGDQRFEVIDRIPAGPLAPVSPGRPIRSANAVPAPVQQQTPAALPVRPLAPTGPPSNWASSVVSQGDTLLTIPVVHGFTGVLRNDVSVGGFFPAKLSAGQYLFGVPVHGLGSDFIIWCAPQTVAEKPGEFSTVCFPPAGAGNLWLNVGPRLFFGALSASATKPPNAIGLSIERKPASLGAPMVLAYVFDEWAVPLGGPQTPAAWIKVEMRVSGVASPVGEFRVHADELGAFRLEMLGGVMNLSGIDRSGTAVPPPQDLTNHAQILSFFRKMDRKKAKLNWERPPQSDGPLPVNGDLTLSTHEQPGFLPTSDSEPH